MPDADLLEPEDLSALVDGDDVPPGVEEIDQSTLPAGTVTAAEETD